MEDTMEAYHEAERVLFILDGDDDPVQEVDLSDILYVNSRTLIE